ncbi:hypothetical protein BH09BAC6_BH09BAC6_23000 [soil metagenome]|jgi:hypothetical protein
MRKHVIITILLLIATALITTIYFKNLSPPGTRTGKILSTIPNNAALIFEYNNEKGFYEIFNNNKVLPAIIGQRQMDELDILRKILLLNPLLEPFFSGQNIFVSFHPSKARGVELLLTASATNNFEPAALEELAKQSNSGLVATPLLIAGKQGYTLYIGALKKRFYIINTQQNIFSGSFSKELIGESSAFKSQRDKEDFVLLPQQQNINSLANLYVNYNQLSALLQQIFQNKSTDIFKSFSFLPALAALSLNYKNDALMFNGLSYIQTNKLPGYLNLFTGQKPVTNRLKEIFPSTTAYCMSFAVSDPLKFEDDLSKWHIKTGLETEKGRLFKKIKAETGISLKAEFRTLLANEFAVVTTRYHEKIAIIAVKDGSKLRPFMMNVSKAVNDNMGEFNYDKLPFFLLGDEFSFFKHPFYLIADNYLILANSARELTSYYDAYINRKFLSKTGPYNEFNELLSDRCNVSFFINFKNAGPILKNDVKASESEAIDNNEPGWKNFYAASYQLTAADNNFYTNLCMRLNTDTLQLNRSK